MDQVRRLDDSRNGGAETIVRDIGNRGCQLMVVVSSAVLDSATWKWTYQLRPAMAAKAAPYATVNKPGYASATTRGLSVSEMGNTSTYVCGGVEVANLPAGFFPVKLHNGAAVWCEAARDEAGVFYWAIVSPTQAIDGVCPE